MPACGWRRECPGYPGGTPPVVFVWCGVRWAAWMNSNLPHAPPPPLSPPPSEHFRKLILSMLHLDPSQRPALSELLALPICQNAILDLMTDMGRIDPETTVGRSGRAETDLLRPHFRASDRSTGLAMSDGSSAFARLFLLSRGSTVPCMQLGIFRDKQAQCIAVGRTQVLAALGDRGVLSWTLSQKASSSSA